jgi:hypothetical protein
LGQGPRGRIPKFGHILDGDVQCLFLRYEPFESASGHSVHGMGWLHRAQQDIRIDEARHLPAVWIQAGAADGLVG